jgi:predicted transposase YbfD/YdcC
MEEAIAMWEGGKVLNARKGNYEDYRVRGMLCMHCHQSVFWRKSYKKDDVIYSAAWCHFQITEDTKLCEKRHLTDETKRLVEKLQPKARGQRLALFNSRFWDIFSHDKDIPKDFYLGVKEKAMYELSEHCRKRWDVKQILSVLPQRVKDITDAENIRKNALIQFANLTEKDIEILSTHFLDMKYNVLRYKILCEVVEWLGTSSAKNSFHKVTTLAFFNAVEIAPKPVRTNMVANFILNSLIMTKWDQNLDELPQPNKGIGFGQPKVTLKK